MEQLSHARERRRRRDAPAESAPAAGQPPERVRAVESGGAQAERVRQAEARVRAQLRHELHPDERPGRPDVTAPRVVTLSAVEASAADSLLADIERQPARRRTHRRPALPPVRVTSRRLAGLGVTLLLVVALIAYLLVAGA